MFMGKMLFWIVVVRYLVNSSPISEKPFICILQRLDEGVMSNPMRTSQLHLPEMEDRLKLAGARKHPMDAKQKFNAFTGDDEIVHVPEVSFRSTLGG